MKKAICAALVLAMACCPFAALAQGETVVVEVTFQGTWIPFEDHNFQIYLPNDWVIFEPGEGMYFACGLEDQSQLFIIEIYENEDYDMRAIFDELSATEGYESVSSMLINGIPFVLFASASEDMRGGVTLSADGACMYFFKFAPGSDEAFSELAWQILSSLSVIK